MSGKMFLTIFAILIFSLIGREYYKDFMPHYNVGECHALISDSPEEWEKSEPEWIIRILKVGDEKYLLEYYSVKYKFWFARATAVFNQVHRATDIEIDCPEGEYKNG